MTSPRCAMPHRMETAALPRARGEGHRSHRVIRRLRAGAGGPAAWERPIGAGAAGQLAGGRRPLGDRGRPGPAGAVELGVGRSGVDRARACVRRPGGDSARRKSSRRSAPASGRGLGGVRRNERNPSRGAQRQPDFRAGQWSAPQLRAPGGCQRRAVAGFAHGRRCGMDIVAGESRPYGAPRCAAIGQSHRGHGGLPPHRGLGGIPARCFAGRRKLEDDLRRHAPLGRWQTLRLSAAEGGGGAVVALSARGWTGGHGAGLAGGLCRGALPRLSRTPPPKSRAAPDAIRKRASRRPGWKAWARRG